MGLVLALADGSGPHRKSHLSYRKKECTGIAGGGLRTRSFNYWNGLERVRRARKDVVVSAPLHATGLGGLIRGQGYVVYLNLVRAATVLGITLELKDYV